MYSWNLINPKSSACKKCAFCKHWFDPACTAIRPKNRIHWEYDPKASKKCTHWGTDRKAVQTCSHFENKLD